MKHRVECYVLGKVFYVECYARDYQDAKRVAKSQYPNAQILKVNVVF
jgi:hypothetical protein